MTSSSSKYQDLGVRLITGFSGAFFAIFCIAYSQWTYGAVFLALVVISQWEFYSLLEKQGRKPAKYLGMLMGLGLFCILFFAEQGLLQFNYYLLLLGVVPFVYISKLYDKLDKDRFINISYTFLGVLYVPLPIALLNTIAFIDKQYHYEYILGLMLMLWASDVGAYFTGRAFGKRKLFFRISPGKTWEGSFGGLILSLLFAFGMAYYYDSLHQWQWLLFCLVIVVFGAYGDLVESMFKRSIMIKDSGTKLPGHGGFLDRFDGLFMASPMLAVLFRILFF